MQPHIRWMIRRDLDEVLDVERRCFEFAWNREHFLRCLGQRNCFGFVAETDQRAGMVTGFMLYELHKTRIHLLNFAVHPSYRGLGIGAEMVAKLKAKLSSHRRDRITLAVRESNLEAQLFFKGRGFQAERVIRDYYEDSGESAYLFGFNLSGERSVNRVASLMDVS